MRIYPAAHDFTLVFWNELSVIVDEAASPRIEDNPRGTQQWNEYHECNVRQIGRKKANVLRQKSE